jgi:hypothetical protein
MKVDLISGLDIHIGGEIAKHNSLPLDFLVRFCSNFQLFVNEIAKNSLLEETIDLSNFKLELSAFFKGSAIPRVIFTSNTQEVLIGNVQQQRITVSTQIDQLLSYSNEGNYYKIKDLYPANRSRNPVVESMYSFINSFGTTPVEFGHYNPKKKSFSSLYKINRFNLETKQNLIIDDLLFDEVIDDLNINTIKTAARVEYRIGEKGQLMKPKVEKSFKTPDLKTAFKPIEIVVNNSVYKVSSLLAEFEKENDHYILKSELLDIVGVGSTEEEAKRSFYEEFDYIYNTYLAMPDKKLSPKLLAIKKVLPLIAQKIK